MQNVRFGTDEVDKALKGLGNSTLDELPFGAILLDPSGKIKAYNNAESRLSGRNAEDVIGKDFFRDVAPCTNVKGFKDKFDEGVRSRNINTVFEMVFDYKMTPTRVRVHMKNAEDGDLWVFTKRL